MLADQFERGGRANFGDRVEVVAAEKDAEVDKLGNGVSKINLLD